MDKIKWYKSLPIYFEPSNVKCHKCGTFAMKVKGSDVLHACIKEECSIGFFKVEVEDEI